MSSINYHPEVETAEHDKATATKRVMLYGWNAESLAPVRLNVDGLGALEAPKATKITESGSYTYIAVAEPGTAQNVAAWQVKRIYDDGAGTITITWADGDASFDNTATDLTALTYS